MRRDLVIACFLIAVVARGIAAAHPPDAAPADTPETCIAALISDSAALSLPVRVERAFMLTLHGAADALRQGEIVRAQTLLRTFAFEVRGVKRARRVPADVADALIARTEAALRSFP